MNQKRLFYNRKQHWIGVFLFLSGLSQIHLNWAEALNNKIFEIVGFIVGIGIVLMVIYQFVFQYGKIDDAHIQLHHYFLWKSIPLNSIEKIENEDDKFKIITSSKTYTLHPKAISKKSWEIVVERFDKAGWELSYNF